MHMVNVNPHMRHLSILFLTLFLTGCQHARSFLNMNSNSSSPFLGLELSVDARDTNSATPATDVDLKKTAGSSIPQGSALATADGASVHLAAMDDGSHNFVATSELRQHTGNLKYALPTVDLDKDPRQAAEVREIMDRLSGS